MDPDLVTIQRAAEILGVHPNTIRNWCDRGVIKNVHRLPSGYRRIPRVEVHRLLQEHYGMTVMTVTTRHPENYLLVNRADGSCWVIKDGKWKRYYESKENDANP